MIAWNVFFCVNCVNWTLWNTYSAVDTFIWINSEKVWAFPETVNGAYIDTIGIFAADTRFSYYVGHDS